MANVLNLKPEEVPEPQPREPSDVDTSDLLGPDSLQWDAHHPLPAHAAYRRYSLMSVLGVAGVAIAWWQASILTGAAVLLGLATWELRERFSRPTSVHIDERGITVDGEHYPATRLTSYDLHRMPDGTHELSIATDSWRARYLRLPLGDQHPDDVRALLARITFEDEHPVPLLDWWLRK